MAQFLITNLISVLLLYRNLNWHRRLVWLAIPMFFISLMLQSEYMIFRLKKNSE